MQLEGWFLFRYRVFDLFSVRNGSQPLLTECWGRPFRIYAAKQFPGLESSTELTKVNCDREFQFRLVALLIFSKLLHSHHVPVHMREVRRKRKKNSDDDSNTDTDQDQPLHWKKRETLTTRDEVYNPPIAYPRIMDLAEAL